MVRLRWIYLNSPRPSGNKNQIIDTPFESAEDMQDLKTGKKKPRTVSGRGKKKRHGPVAPARGVGYSSLIVLNAADRRRDWHPGGGSRDMNQAFVLQLASFLSS